MSLTKFALLLITGISLLSGIACSRYNRKIIQENHIKKEFRHIFSNPILNTQISFFGDYKFSSRKPDDFNHYKQSSLWRNRITHLFTAKTTISPFINCVTYVVKKNNLPYYTTQGFVPVNDSLLTKNSKTNPTQVVKEFIFARPLYDICMVAWSDLDPNTPDFANMDQLNEVFNDEMNQIIRSVSSVSYNTLKSPFNLAEELFHTERLGNYLSPIDTLNKLRSSYQNDLIYNDLYLQALATYHSFIGNDACAQENLAERFKMDTSVRKFEGKQFNTDTGLKRLTDLMSQEQVVMFNESHFSPLHRELISSILPGLKERGFKYLALEALHESTRRINKRGFPTLESGFYIRDYRMSNLIRHAIGLGYIIVNYESSHKQKNREFAQALNLYDQTIRKDSQAKVLILSGHAHINETDTTGKKWMAQYFHEISGINPFTINQEKYSGAKVNSMADTSALIILRPKNNIGYQNDLYLVNNLQKKNSAITSDNAFLTTINLDDSAKLSVTPAHIRMYRLEEYMLAKRPSPCYNALVNNHVYELLIGNGNYMLILDTNGQQYEKKLNIAEGKVTYYDH